MEWVALGRAKEQMGVFRKTAQGLVGEVEEIQVKPEGRPAEEKLMQD